MTADDTFALQSANRTVARLMTARNPKQRIQLARELALITGEITREAVQDARRAGRTWDTIGTWMGISRQAAQQRFTPANRVLIQAQMENTRRRLHALADDGQSFEDWQRDHLR